MYPKHSINRLFRDLPPNNTAFLYHRWDIAKWPGKKCKQFARYATTGKSFFKEYNELFFFLIEYVNEKQIVRYLGTQVEFHEYHNLNSMYYYYKSNIYILHTTCK